MNGIFTIDFYSWRFCNKPEEGLGKPEHILVDSGKTKEQMPGEMQEISASGYKKAKADYQNLSHIFVVIAPL